QGPSSKVSTTSLSARKSSCLKCSKPKPGPLVVSISTTRLTPSASGLAQAVFAGDTAAALAGILAGMAAVTSTSSRVTGLAAAVAAGRAAGAAATAGTGTAARGAAVQNQTAVITTAVTKLPNIRPNALRMVTLSHALRIKLLPGINEK